MWRLMILLAVLCPANVIAQSQIHQNAVGNAKNVTAQEQAGTIKAPFVVTISPPSDAEKKASDERQQRKEELDSRLVEYTKDLSIFTKVLAGAAILQLFVFGYQAWKLRQTVIATKNSADAALKTAQNMEAAERAYVKMSHCPPGLHPAPLPNSLYIIDVQVKNFGETPAIVTDLVLVKRILPRSQRLPPIPEYSPRADGETPNIFLVREDEFFTTINFPMMDEERFIIEGNTLEGRTHILYIYGYIDYIDKFGGHHRGGYARVFNGIFSETNNLNIVIQAGYNYDRQREKGEGNDWGDQKT